MNENEALTVTLTLDNDEELLFSQNGDQCSYRAVGFPYGTHWIVRVAKVDFE